jgi:hypothetical protein
MTTYLGEKAVGIGTVKANMNVGKVITDEKTILGDGFTEQLAVNTLLFATSESVAASAEAVRTEFDGRLKAVEGEITNVEDDVRELRKGTHDELVDIKLDVSDLKDADTQIRAEITNVEDRVRELTKYTDGEFVDIKLDVSDLKDADQNIRTEMAGIQTQVTAQIAGKQDKLTPGENITIEDGVISATGGGGASLPDQTGNAGKFLTTDGTNTSWGKALVNAYTGTSRKSLVVTPDNVLLNKVSYGGIYLVSGSATLGTFMGQSEQVVIGTDITASGAYTVTIGAYASNKGYDGSIAIGSSAGTSGATTDGDQIAIGHYAKTAANRAIQLGKGTNSDASTFKVGLSANNNYELLSADGTIPAERMSATAGTTGQVLTKTDTGMEWQDATGGGELPDNVLVNNATGAMTISIGGTGGGSYSLCVGEASRANAFGSTALGFGCVANAMYAIQLGNNGQAVTNSDANTFKVANGNGNFEMMDANGNVPLDRLTYVTDQIGDISTALTAILGE